MTKVSFYTGSPDKLKTACQISHRAMQDNLRVLLYVPEKSLAEELDHLLWHYSETAFLPHCQSHDAAADDTPIIISQNHPLPYTHQLIINLHDDCPPTFSRFERVVEIVGTQATEITKGRERYSFYKNRGYELKHFDLSKA